MRELLEGLPATLAGSGTVCLAVGLTAAWLLRRRPARAHSVLVLAAGGALVTPLLFLAVQRANWGILPAARTEARVVPLAPDRSALRPAPSMVSVPDQEWPSTERREVDRQPPAKAVWPSSRAVVAGVWMFLSAALSLRLLVDVVAGCRAVGGSRRESDPALLAVLRRAALRIGAWPLPRLHTSRGVASPALWGWSRPAIVLVPESVPLAQSGEVVFCHELAHLRRGDHWTALLAELLVCALPWHPLAWLSRRWLAGWAEEACDDWVVACGCAPLEYAETLVSLTPTAIPALTVAAVSRHSPLATRVRRLLNGGLRPPWLGRRWLAGATCGALLFTMGWALWQPRRAEADDPKAAAPRGVIVRGRVTDPEGTPITNAIVIHGDDPYFAATKSDLRVDDQGRYELPELPPGEITLTVIAPGWAPQLRRVRLRDGLPPQDFQVARGKPIRLRIVDEAGKPMPRAEIIVAEWQERRSLHNQENSRVYPTGIPRNADETGLWEWDWAPEIPVNLEVGWIRHAYVPLRIAGGTSRTVVLKPEHGVTGRVADATTGRPIRAFTVIPVSVYRKDFLSANRGNRKESTAGRLSYLATRAEIALRLRVEAEGYRTKDGPEFRTGDDAARTQDFWLQPSPPITGTVVDPSGRPLASANVLLATPTQTARLLDDRDNQKATTDDAGRFAFPDPGEPWAVVARGDAGYAIAEFPADQHDAGVLHLRPWASIRGRFVDGGRPVPKARVIVDSIRMDRPGRPRIDAALRAVTDADGRFEFPRVPPGPTCVAVLLGPWKDEGYGFGPQVPLDLQPGLRAELELGSGGVTVTGRVRLTGKVPAGTDCAYSLNSLVRREPGLMRPAEIAALGLDATGGLQAAWLKSDAGREYLTTVRRWLVKLAPDGSFRIGGVSPGDYDLQIAIYSRMRGSGTLMDPLVESIVHVTVPAASAGGEVALPDIAAEVVPVPTARNN